MDARCDTDPVDRATDVCEQCGGEYCDQHLVHPFGDTRPPLCRACAVAVAGVRAGAAPPRRRSRSQISKRRKELRQQEAERGLQEAGLLSLPPPGTGGQPGRSISAPALGLDEPSPPPPATVAGIVPEPRDQGSTEADGHRRRWFRFAGRGSLPAAPAGPPEERRGRPDLPQPTDEPFSPSPGFEQPAATPSPTSATILLTRLRESGAFPSSPPAPAPPSDPLAAPPVRPPAALPAPTSTGPVRPTSPRPVPQRPKLPPPAQTLPPVAPPGDGPNRLGAVFGRAAATPLLPPPQPGSPPEAEPDDPWSDVPPALRGPDRGQG